MLLFLKNLLTVIVDYMTSGNKASEARPFEPIMQQHEPYYVWTINLLWYKVAAVGCRRCPQIRHVRQVPSIALCVLPGFCEARTSLVGDLRVQSVHPHPLEPVGVTRAHAYVADPLDRTNAQAQIDYMSRHGVASNLPDLGDEPKWVARSLLDWTGYNPLFMGAVGCAGLDCGLTKATLLGLLNDSLVVWVDNGPDDKPGFCALVSPNHDMQYHPTATEAFGVYSRTFSERLGHYAKIIVWSIFDPPFDDLIKVPAFYSPVDPDGLIVPHPYVVFGREDMSWAHALVNSSSPGYVSAITAMLRDRVSLPVSHPYNHTIPVNSGTKFIGLYIQMLAVAVGEPVSVFDHPWDVARSIVVGGAQTISREARAFRVLAQTNTYFLGYEPNQLTPVLGVLVRDSQGARPRTPPVWTYTQMGAQNCANDLDVFLFGADTNIAAQRLPPATLVSRSLLPDSGTIWNDRLPRALYQHNRFLEADILTVKPVSCTCSLVHRDHTCGSTVGRGSPWRDLVPLLVVSQVAPILKRRRLKGNAVIWNSLTLQLLSGSPDSVAEFLLYKSDLFGGVPTVVNMYRMGGFPPVVLAQRLFGRAANRFRLSRLQAAGVSIIIWQRD